MWICTSLAKTALSEKNVDPIVTIKYIGKKNAANDKFFLGVRKYEDPHFKRWMASVWSKAGRPEK